MLQEFLQQTFLCNPMMNYCWFLGIIILGIIFKRLIAILLSKFLFRFFKKYSTGVGFDKFLLLLVKPFNLLVLLITFYIAFDRLEFPSHWNLVPKEAFGIRMIFFKVFQIAIVVSMTWILLRIVDFFALVLAYKAAKTETKTDDQLVPFIKETLKVIITIFSIFFILGTIFKLNIASIIAGLGIGGLAIALAAKETLENLLGSFTIFVDKPFAIGDFVQVGTISGHVEKIGFRSTRLRTLEKTYVTVPNKKMVDVELDNLSLRTFFRAKFTIALAYETSAEQMKAIVADLRNSINAHPSTQQSANVRFLDFGNNALNITVEYFVHTTDWNVFAQVKEELNFKIMEVIKKHGSSFAFVYPAAVKA